MLGASHRLTAVAAYVDDLNLRSRYVLALMRAAQEADARCEVLDFLVSVEQAIARDKARGDAGGRSVGADLIRTLAERFTDAGTPKPVRF